MSASTHSLPAFDEAMPIRQAAQRYIEKGLKPLRLKPRDKIPAGKVPANTVTLENIEHLLADGSYNLGVCLGKASAGLVDIDLDWPEARIVGETMFDPLPCFGRSSAKGSHRLAICPGAKSIKLSLPASVQDKRLPDQHALTVLEVRAAGHTMFPPSVPPCGERVAWEKESEPPTLEWSLLRERAGLAAFLAVCIRFWPQEGFRDDTAMALAGALLSTGIGVDSVDRAAKFVANAAGDEEYEKRAKAKQTSEKKSRGEPTTGMTRLVELLGLPPECVKTFHQWLQTKPEPEAPSSDAKEDAVVLDPRSPRENAREFIKRCFTIDNDRTLVHHQDEYFVYERGRYRPIELTAIHSKLYEFTETSFFKSGDKLEPFRPKQQNITTIEHALRSLVLVEKNVLQPPCWISGIGPRPTDLVVCQNGIFDLATGELMPHTPRLFTFNALNIDYDPAAPSPERWLQFLDEVFPDDEESIRTLQEIFGYLLTPETRQQKAFMMVAPPRSGKGTIARVIEQLVGKPNFAGIHLASLGETFGLQPLIGKLVAVVTDARLGSKSDKAALVEKILSISGEDAVQINRKYIPQWEGRLATRFFIHTNEVPNLPDASGAFVNRFIVLTTASSFLGREDHALGERLMTELPGILRWAIEGWRRLRERGRFLQPASAAELIEMFAKVSSPVKSFVDEWCHLGPDLRCDKERLYEEWVKWSNTQGRGSFLSKDQFCAKLYAAFPEVKPGKGSRSEGRPPELRGICPNIDYWEPHQVKIPF